MEPNSVEINYPNGNLLHPSLQTLCYVSVLNRTKIVIAPKLF